MSEEGMRPTMTIEQATQNLERHLARTKKAFSGDVEFEMFANRENSPCEDQGQAGPKGKKFSSRIYQIKNVPAAEVRDQISKLDSWWRSNGYEIVERKDDVVRAKSTKDDYVLGLEVNPKNELYLLGDSTCVWPNGTPEPEDSGI